MGDKDRGPLPCQAAGGGGCVPHKVSVHAGERLIHQQGLGITAQQRAQQRGAALLPAGKPYCGQAQVSLGKAEGLQLGAGLRSGQTVAGQHQIVHGSQVGAKAVLLKNSGGRFHTGDGAAVGSLQSQQDTQQRSFSAAGNTH